jgi:hypothetical protein
MVKLNQVWRKRITTGSHGAGRMLLVILVVTSSISGLSTVKHWLFPPAPLPVAAIARDVVNQTDLVKAFAIDCVSTYLTAATAHGTDLSRCFPNADQLSMPATPALIVSEPMAHAFRVGPRRGDYLTYGVLVGVTEQVYATAVPQRNYYQISVGVYGGDAVRAVDNLARIDGPPAGTEVALRYPVTIADNHPIAGMLGGFMSAFLTASPGLDLERFITTDSQLTKVSHPYLVAYVGAVQAISQPPDNPVDNTTLSVRVGVSVRSAEYVQYDLSYPLTLRASGGNWFVAGIDAVPALAESIPDPPENSAAPQ